jgi:hypothetical protein
MFTDSKTGSWSLPISGSRDIWERGTKSVETKHRSNVEKDPVWALK